MARAPDLIPRDASDNRVAKLLARAGIASRREVERMIAEGRVALNGEAITTPATLLASLAGVTVDGQPVEAPAPARLFLYHKPAGLLVTERDPGGRPTIYDRLPKSLPRVVPVGRLDLATEGLLLLTTDGGLKRQLELPATGVERSYRARAYGPVTQAMLEELIHGVEVEGVRYGAIDANLERRTGANAWIEMTLTEGKNREVRRVLEYLGLKVGRLIRTRYGPFVLGDLPPGEVAEVRAHDIDSFRKNPTRKDLPQPARKARATMAEAAPVRSPPIRPAAPVRGRGTPAPAPVATPRPARQPRNAPPAAGTKPPRALTNNPPGKPGRPPRGGKKVRVRADGSEAVVAKPARAARARTFRNAGEPRTVTPAAPPAGPSKPRPGSPRPPRKRG